MIEDLLLSLSSATDPLGVPLLSEEMQPIWDEQKKHVSCIQDPPSISLYTITGHLFKGGVKLPILRCARGSTSLESFHLHLARFIPGSSASAVNFQAYLLDGITRWNSSRAVAAIESPEGNLRTFDSRLQEKINSLSSNIYGTKVFPLYQPPSKYTGELFGVEYLYEQSNLAFAPAKDLDSEIDEGFEDVTDVTIATVDQSEHLITVPPPDDDENDTDDENEVRFDAFDSCIYMYMYIHSTYTCTCV